jgi:hypothetical protein
VTTVTCEVMSKFMPEHSRYLILIVEDIHHADTYCDPLLAICFGARDYGRVQSYLELARRVSISGTEGLHCGGHALDNAGKHHSTGLC